MQAEIGLAVPPGAGGAIRILGVNEAGQESGNPLVVQGCSIPWLQDSIAEHVWGGKWPVAYRDVVVLDDQNRRLAVFNLTTHDLGEPANYAYLRDLLRAAASCGSASISQPAGSVPPRR